MLAGIDDWTECSRTDKYLFPPVMHFQFETFSSTLMSCKTIMINELKDYFGIPRLLATNRTLIKFIELLFVWVGQEAIATSGAQDSKNEVSMPTKY